MKIHYKTIKKNFFEQNAWKKSLYVCGIDEVGRGSLAGPLLTAAVILHQNKTHRLLKDSKLLTQEKREKAYQWIIKNSFYSVAMANHHTIDNINIYQATLQTMRKALSQLLQIIPIAKENLSHVLIDAMPLDLGHKQQYTNIRFVSFEKGESRSTSIAAASIVAKVTRDKLMKKFNTIIPAYAFDKNKGYASKHHRSTLKKLGPSIIHRTTFITHLQKETVHEEKQKGLFR
jgi:ribonuclease HII